MSEEIRSRPEPRCILCGAQGRALYTGSRDRLFSAPGVWAHSQCINGYCGLIWLDPMPLPDDLHKAYQSYYTHEKRSPRSGAIERLFAAAKRGYLANRFGYGEGVSLPDRLMGVLPWIYPGRPAELDFSVMWLSGIEQDAPRLLDVGAGSGWLMEQMNALGWRAEGVDFDPRAVDQAQARGMKMHRGSLAEQNFPESSFDAVTMSHSVEHVPDPVGFLTEARRILRAGGRLSVATPNTRSMLHREFRRHWFALDPPRHLHLFNRDALADALRKAGFERFRIFTSIRDANGAFLGSRAIRDRGRHDMTARPAIAERIRGRRAQLVEAVKAMFDRDAGEDLVALAEK
jgi:2-polyprenyl-3-methyl-5-hydroxy-6-metoxy-1,4-benzoquinol methylase